MDPQPLPPLHPGPSATANAASLERELDWLSRVLDARIRIHFGQDGTERDIRELAPPDLDGDPSAFARTLRDQSLNFDERLVLALALAPHIRPQALDPFLVKNRLYDRGFTEFGGLPAAGHVGFWPSLETALFLLAGEDLEQRFAAQALFDQDQPFSVLGLISVDGPEAGQALQVGAEFLHLFTLGAQYRPGFSSAFPAKRIATALDWDDLVLAEHILEEVEEIRAWIQHRHTLLHDWQLERKIKPGYRCLFHGPPGTGKTLTASLLGKATGLDVYRVDLSLVVSKYIGETEKNLANVFDQAQNRDWILFFDEADALFGKRTQTSSAHDRYANQEVAYLLQRVEDFPGVVILATNLKGNLDEAFARRFQSMIYFPMPDPEARRRLWDGAFSSQCRLEAAVDLRRIAEEHELAGGAIINVARYASLMALRRGGNLIRLQDIRNGIRRELRKDGKLG
jgi:hypothetical protein